MSCLIARSLQGTCLKIPDNAKIRGGYKGRGTTIINNL